MKAFICNFCGKEFTRTDSDSHKFKTGQRENIYCSHKCFSKKRSKEGSVEINCGFCNKLLIKQKNEVKKSKSGKVFCNRSCMGKYHNANKKHGSKRSKLELYIQNQLTNQYPNLEILYNDISAIGSELDIYIPSLCLAFELNGIFHYEPIFGEDKLSKTQTNDQRKFQACIENNIALCIIDT